MELLSRRSSSDRMSTLKRSRSFRASMKLMSKLRSRASMRLNGGFDLSPSNLQHSKRKRDKLSLVEEGVVSPPTTTNNNNNNTVDPSIENRPSRTDNETPPVPRDDRLSSTPEFESRKIAKELSKLCLADLMTEKNRKCRGSRKMSDEISPKVTTRHMFRWRRSNGEEGEEEEEESEEKKRAPFPWTTAGGHVSYENPTFRLDASLDSSMSAFFFESENSGRVANEGDECKDDRGYADERWPGGTASTNSKNDTRKGRESEVGLEDDCRRASEFERGLLTGAKARSLSVNDVVLRDEEVASSLVLNKLGCLDDGEASKGRKSSEKIRKTSVCSSKSCRIRTVDNIANFWTNARGGSFRSKVSVGRKKSIKESRDSHDSLGQDRVLVTTTSGSSTAHQVSFF